MFDDASRIDLQEGQREDFEDDSLDEAATREAEATEILPASDKDSAEPRPSPIDAAQINNLMTLYLRDVRRYRPLDAAREAALVARFAVESDTGARDELICHHLGLVIAMARKFSNRGLDLLDLIEEGNLGMLVALSKFDASRGLRFSTYAAWWIRYYLQTAIATQVPIVRPPLRAQQRANKEAWQQWHLSHEPGHGNEPHSPTAPPTRTPLVTPLSLHDDDIEAHFAAANLCHPDVMHAVTERLDASKLSFLLHSLVAGLPERQRDLVIARFGLDGEDECTLQDLGTEQGVSRERMRQIQVQALDTLREGLASAGVDRGAALA